jgi:glutathione S-transferase
MQLYYSETLNPRKVCAIARQVGAPVEYVHIDLRKGEHKTPEFRAINPNQKVPALVEGDRRLWESNAIMTRLAVAAGSDLWPAGERQIDVIRWLSWDGAHFTRFGGILYFQHIVKAYLGIGAPDLAAVAEAQGRFRTAAVVLDEHLSDRRWLVGDSPTIADFAVAVSLPYAEKSAIPLDEFPAICRWHDRLSELDAWREPFPVRAATAASPPP